MKFKFMHLENQDDIFCLCFKIPQDIVTIVKKMYNRDLEYKKIFLKC